MTLTLRVRLAAISTIVFGVLLATLSVLSYEVFARRLDTDVTAQATQLAEGLHGYLRFAGDGVAVHYDQTDEGQAAFVHQATRYYRLYDAATGRLLTESPGIAPLPLRLTPSEVGAFAASPAPFDVETPYVRLRIANSVRTQPDGRRYLLQVGVSLAPMGTALRHYATLLSWSVPLALLVAAFAAWWLSGFALRPLSRMAGAARLIDVATLERRIPLRGVDDELDQVGRALNETLGRLEHAVGEMRQFSAALAHELRTPLAALRAEAELNLRAPGTSETQQRVFSSQIEEIDRLANLIDRVLTMARAEAGEIRLACEPVDLGDLARSVVEQLEPIAEARTVTLRCEAPVTAIVDGDVDWLRRLLLNLLGNALDYTRAGGDIVVRVFRARDRARIDVRDSGVGLSAEDAKHIFEKFFRADPARSARTDGAGLGLSLVQWIAGQHGGNVTVQSRLGEGSTFSVSLPLSAAKAVRARATSPAEH